MKTYYYALKENDKVVLSKQPHFGWKQVSIEDGKAPIKTAEERLIEKYKAMCLAAPTEAAKNDIRKEFIKVREQHRKECAERLKTIYTNPIKWAPKNTKPESKKPAVLKYWELDNYYFDKWSGSYTQYLKRIIEATGQLDQPWKWVGKTYEEISRLDYYKDLTISCKDRRRTISEAIEVHTVYHRKATVARDSGDDITYNKYKKACAILKEKIDTALDKGSQQLQTKLSYAPERLVSLINNPIPADDTIIAVYPLDDKGYNGVVTQVDCGVTLYQAGVDVHTGEPLYRWSEDDHIIKTNGDVTFGNLIYDAKYHWLPTVIAEAKTFGYTPRTIEGFYHRSEGIQTIYIGDGQYKEIPNGIRGMCITVNAALELQTIVNYCKGEAELGLDLSDKTTIHHEDGIQTQTITEYEYKKNREKYLDWKETECRDFQFELDYNEEEEVM